MEFKGTKEPWKLVEDYDHSYSQQIFNIANEVDGCMATIWTGKDEVEEISEETKANALLISKAPEMLEKHFDEIETLQNVIAGIPLGLQHLKNTLKELIKEKEQLIKEVTEP